MALQLIRKTNAGLEDAPHLTFTRIVNTAHRQFGFARLDDGSEAYIPAMVVNRYNLHPEDEGAGFRARLHAQPPGSAKQQPVVLIPVQFDDTSPEVVDIPDQDLDADLLAERDLIKGKLTKLEELLPELDTLITNMKLTREEVTKDIECANELHNQITALLQD